MRRVCRAIAAISIVCGLSACATVSTTPMESQSKQRDSRLARLYFIWPRSAMFRTATFDIKVDGRVVGKIAPDSYFFVDRQPGTYTLKVEPPFDWAYFETDVQVTAGGTYYYAINVKPAYVPITGGGVAGVMTISHPQIGAPMQPKERGMSFATYKLNVLDATTAAAEMAKLDGR
jgi:Protein of unknown function (DUF2846)